jgi:solute carrier family 35, member F5
VSSETSDSPSKQPDLDALVLGGTIPRIAVGNILALLSALFYAMYVILLKVRIKAEYRIDMQLFFGFVGLFNILACWLVGLILHLTGVEIFELPHTKLAIYAILINVRVYFILVCIVTELLVDGNHPFQ